VHRILCVEDEPDLRAQIVEEIQDAGYETVEAANGAQGIEAVLQYEPDLIICDITMLVMNGYEMLMALRERYPQYAEISFVYLSALGERDRVIAGRQLGADEYLTKPIDYEVLLTSIESRLAQMDRINETKRQTLAKLVKTINAPGPGGDEDNGFQSMTVVVIDDGRTDVDEVCRLLALMGHGVVRITGGTNVFDQLDELTPDAVLVSYDSMALGSDQLARVVKMGRGVGFPTILLVPPSFSRMKAYETLGFSEFDEGDTAGSWLDTLN